MINLRKQSKDWRVVRFKDFVKLQRGFDLPKKDRKGGIYPVVASTSVVGYHSEYKVEAPCVSTGRSGSLGEVQYVNERCWPLNTVLWVKDFKGNDPKFVYYLLGILGLQKYNSGAGVPTLNRNDLDGLDIIIPNISIQKKIVSVLSAYDDLIENNTKRIKILEDMAQAIYNEWFVKFRFPGYEKVKMVESGTEFGKIPEGWEVKKVEDFVDFVRGVEPGSKNYEEKNREGLIPFLRVGDLNKRCSNIFIDKNLAKERILDKCDVVVSMDGSVGIVRIRMKGAYSTGIRKLVVKSNRVNREFLYYLMLSDNIQDVIKEHAKGTTILHASESIKYMRFVLSLLDMMEKFESYIKPKIDLIINLLDQNDNLRQTRDLLLPKLMNGEVIVK